MRTSFELKIMALDINDAKRLALEDVARFLKIEESEVLDNVSLELKVSYPEAKTFAEIAQNIDGEMFVVTVYGSVKQSIAKPFGF